MSRFIYVKTLELTIRSAIMYLNYFRQQVGTVMAEEMKIIQNRNLLKTVKC